MTLCPLCGLSVPSVVKIATKYYTYEMKLEHIRNIENGF